MTLATPKKGLSLSMLTALVIGNMIGSGIFLLPASLASFGTISLFSWVLTGGGSIILALMFMQLSKLVPKTGGPYIYCHEGFGDCLGFIIAYSYWVAIWVANAAMAVAAVGYMGSLWPALNQADTVHYRPGLVFALEVGIIWFFTGVNLLRVRTAGSVIVLTTALKILPLLLISLGGLFYLNMDLFGQFNISGKSNMQALTGAAALTLWAFIGLESATVPAEEANDPRDVPRATIIGTLATLAVYVLASVAIMGIIPAETLKNSQAPFADAANILFGSKAAGLVAGCAIISCLGCISGWILVQGQVPMAAAKDGLFPTVFSKKNRFNMPAHGQIISSILITILLIFTVSASFVEQFTFIILLATLAYLITYFMCAVAELLILIRNPANFSKKRLIYCASVAILASIYSLWMMVGAGTEIVFYGSLFFFSGFLVYAWLKWTHSKKHGATTLQ